MFSWLPKGNADQAPLVDEDNLVSADNDELRAETQGCGEDNGIKSMPNSPAKCYKILSKSLQIMHKYAWWLGGLVTSIQQHNIQPPIQLIL